MKRIRQFTIIRLDTGAEERLDSWHKSWDRAAELLGQQVRLRAVDESVVHIIDSLCDILIAKFSTSNEQVIQHEQGVHLRRLTKEEIRWETKPLSIDRDDECLSKNGEPTFELYANLNVSDVYWTWVAGAYREVPIRMNFVQRKASRNPDGIWALGSGIVNECRDWLRR